VHLLAPFDDSWRRLISSFVAMVEAALFLIGNRGLLPRRCNFGGGSDLGLQVGLPAESQSGPQVIRRLSTWLPVELCRFPQVMRLAQIQVQAPAGLQV